VIVGCSRGVAGEVIERGCAAVGTGKNAADGILGVVRCARCEVIRALPHDIPAFGENVAVPVLIQFANLPIATPDISSWRIRPAATCLTLEASRNPLSFEGGRRELRSDGRDGYGKSSINLCGSTMSGYYFRDV
jgi:hypothetical protein